MNKITRENPLPRLAEALKVTEPQFATAVEDLLTRFGWRWIHSRPARTLDGSWRTPLSGDEGWPDYFAVREGRIVVAELKSDNGELAAEQYFWLCDLAEAGLPVYLWQPKDDFDEIAGILR